MIAQASRRLLGILADANLLIGLMSCIFALGLAFGHIPWPFAGPVPNQTGVLATHFGLAAAAFLFLLLQLRFLRWQASRIPDWQPSVVSFIALRTLAASLAGMMQLAIIFWTLDNGMQGRDWTRWLLVPGVSGTLAFFLMTDGAPVRAAPEQARQPEQTVGTIKITASQRVKADMQFANDWRLLPVIRTGLIFGLGTMEALAGLVVFVIYRQFMVRAFYNDQFPGWRAFAGAIWETLDFLVPFLLIVAVFQSLVLVGEQLADRTSLRFIKSQKVGSKIELEKGQADLIDATVERLNLEIHSTKRSNLDRLQNFLWILGILVVIVVALILSAWPVFLTIASQPIGYSNFESERIFELYPVIYIDSIGGFEVGISLATLGMFFYIFSRILRMSPALIGAGWRSCSVDQLQIVLIRSAAQAVLSGEIKSSKDLSVERAYALMLMRYEKGATFLIVLCTMIAAMLWPLDRAHYGLIADDVLASGHYYVPGSVQSFSVDEAIGLRRACHATNDGEAILWNVILPNRATIRLVGQWKEADEEQRAMLLRVMEKLIARDVELKSRVDRKRCLEFLTARFGQDAGQFAPFFGIEANPSSVDIR